MQKKRVSAAAGVVMLKSGAVVTGALIMAVMAPSLVARFESWQDSPFRYSLRDAALALHDPLLYLEERSPGGRASGVLLQTKGVRQAMINTSRRHGPGAAPYERVLANVLGPYAVPALDDDLVPRGQVPDIGEHAFAPGSGPSGGGSNSNGLSPQSAPQSSPSILNGAAATPPVVTPAIPEPSSWIMLLWGFLVTGLAVRFNKRHTASGESRLRPDI